MRPTRCLIQLLLFLVAACGKEEGPRPALPAERGLPYDAFYLPFDLPADQVKADLADLKALGATRIYFTCTEADAADDRKIRAVLSAARGLGLQVFADPYIGGVFSADEGRTARRYLDQHPGDREISRRGVTVDIPAYNSPTLRAYLKAQLRELLRHDFDGLLLDEPWFPDPPEEEDYYPHDATSQVAFAARFGHAMPDVEDGEVEAFRQASMKGFIGELTDFAKSLRPSLETVLVVLPEDEAGRPDRRGTRDWSALSRIATLDGMQTDPYWPSWGEPFAFFERNVERLQAAVQGTRVRAGIWVQAYSLRGGDSGTVSEGLLHARRRGVPSINAWLTPQFPNGDDAAVRAALADGFR